MTLFPLLVILEAGLPKLAPLEPPIAEFSPNLFGEVPVDAPEGADRRLPISLDKCPQKTVSAVQALGTALQSVDRLQRWLDGNPGVERRLFKNATLADVSKHLTYAQAVGSRPCGDAALVDGWKWKPALSGKLCAVASRDAQESWVGSRETLAAGAVLVRPASDPCQPRLSVALFDSRGRNRLILNADFGGAMSATLVGDTCQIEFLFDAPARAFKPQWKNCKG